MKINLVPAYDHPHKAFPYTHRAEAIIPSLGTFYDGFQIPALYLMADYHFDQKTGLLVHDVKLTFRPNGPCAARLNFPHAEVKNDYKHANDRGMYIFKVSLHAVFNEDVVIRETYKGEGSIGAERIVKGSIGGSYEKSRESHPAPVTLHAEYNGTLYTKQNILKVGGAMK